jgi:DnaJ like chaperone protein
MWYGKLIGALIGLLIGRGIAGAIIGAFIGHLFDVERGQRGGRRSNASMQQIFFRVTFQVMGHVAKADGRVSQQEIQAARAMMAQFRLSEADVRQAIELFTQGKASDFPVSNALRELVLASRNRSDLRLMFVQIQLQTALLGGGLNPASRAILRRCCDVLGISEYQFAQMEATLGMQGRASGSGTTANSGKSSLSEAYQVLGVTSAASKSDVTKAYRRLMSHNHPDKLVAKGLPESMMKAAEEKTRSIRAAYELICAARGIK